MMDTDDTISISKSKKGKGSGSPKKKKKPITKKTKSEKYLVGKGYSFPPKNGETEKARDMRFQLYEDCIFNILEEVEDIQSDMNYQVFNGLVEFISEANKDSGVNMPLTEIPTAALFAGVNMPDHHATFEQLQEEIIESSNSHVALLQSKDCPNLKCMVKEMLVRIMRLDDDDGCDSDEDMVNKSITTTKPLKSWQYTFSELRDWYQKHKTVNLQSPSPSKSGKKRKVQEENVMQTRSSLVIIFEDFEGFNAKVLQDFILICSEYAADLPFVLVFGVATTANAIHQSLSHTVSSRLSIRKFQAHPPIFALTEIINKVLLSNKFAWKLGPAVLRMLYENFLYYDFSIQNFVKGLKLSIMEHFYDNALSILCTSKEDQIKKHVSMLSSKQCDELRSTPSMARYISRKSLKEQEQLTSNSAVLKETAAELMSKLLNKLDPYFVAVKCLHIMTSKLPGAPLGKKLLDVFELCFKKNILNHDAYGQSIELIRLMSRDDLHPLIQKCIEVLSVEQKRVDTVLAKDKEKLQKLIVRLENIQDAVCEQSEVEEKSELPQTTQNKPVKYKSRHEFQEGLKKAVKEKRKETPFEKLRSEIIDRLDNMFRRYLVDPLGSTPMIEALFFDRKDVIKEAVDCAPRNTVHIALNNPGHFLQCSCCKLEKDDIVPTLPDICILYKLHAECGKLINLYDWLQSFQAIIKDEEEAEEFGVEINKDILARFICGVSTLQLLGFVKPTKRKTDHVARLTWGGD